MKKIISLVVLLAAVTMTAQAQGVKFGVKGGLNITKMSVSKDVADPDNQTGFYVGPTVKLSLPLGFGVDIAALYDQRSAKIEADGDTGIQGAGNEKITQKSLNIPVNARYNIGLGSKAGIYLAVGPQFGFPVGDKVYNTQLGEYRLNDANLSFNFGAGVYLLKHLEIGFTYNLAAGKSGEFKNFNDVDTHNNAWQIGAAVYF
ncbi:MAG: porin family protein [Prevotella sp.]|nr:porin family protein [Prevotella sp.]